MWQTRNAKDTFSRSALCKALIFAILLIGQSCSKREPEAYGGRGGSADYPGTNVKEGSPSGRGISPATGPPMTYELPSLTSVSEILANTNSTGLSTQTVQLTGVPVQRVFSPQYVLVGSDANHVLVVRFKELHPEIRPGQKLNISGMISQLGEDLAHWELNPEDKKIVSRYSIFINAIRTEASG